MMNPNTGGLTLADYPRDMVRLTCPKCGRAGQYRRDALRQRFGAGAALPDVLVALADCELAGNMSDPCQVVFRDLAGPAE